MSPKADTCLKEREWGALSEWQAHINSKLTWIICMLVALVLSNIALMIRVYGAEGAATRIEGMVKSQ